MKQVEQQENILKHPKRSWKVHTKTYNNQSSGIDLMISRCLVIYYKKCFILLISKHYFIMNDV